MKTTLRKLTAAWPLVIFLVLPALTRAETAVQAWVQRYNGGGATAVAVDGSNNVIVTGSSTTIKYSSGGVPLWTNLYKGYGEARAVAVDSSNNVIVTGYSNNGGEGYTVYATIKYSSAGVPLWTNRYNLLVNANDYAYAVAVDGSNNVIVTGSSADAGASSDYATIKYSSDGVPLWTNRYYALGSDMNEAHAVAVDGSNNVIVTGYSHVGHGGSYYATVKYSSAGVPLWSNLYIGSAQNSDRAEALAVDGSNNVILTGTSYVSSGGPEYATIKYSSVGVPLWTNHYNGGCVAKALAVDSSNNVIVTGSSDCGNSVEYATINCSSGGVLLWTNRYSGPGRGNGAGGALALAVDGSNNVIVTGGSAGTYSAFPTNYDYVTIKYSGAGVPLWTNRYNGPGNGDDRACAVAADRSGNVIVTGSSTGSGGDSQIATIKYVFPLVVTDLKLTNGTFEMGVDNVQPGSLVIQASTNLAGWAPVFTNTTPTNVLFYTDPAAGDGSTRFYRAFQFP